jgi:hypothetical protein
LIIFQAVSFQAGRDETYSIAVRLTSTLEVDVNSPVNVNFDAYILPYFTASSTSTFTFLNWSHLRMDGWMDGWMDG